MQLCTTTVLFICLVDGLLQVLTRRKLHDWILRLIRGQKSGVHQKFEKTIQLWSSKFEEYFSDFYSLTSNCIIVHSAKSRIFETWSEPSRCHFRWQKILGYRRMEAAKWKRRNRTSQKRSLHSWRHKNDLRRTTNGFERLHQLSGTLSCTYGFWKRCQQMLKNVPNSR